MLAARLLYICYACSDSGKVRVNTYKVFATYPGLVLLVSVVLILLVVVKVWHLEYFRFVLTYAVEGALTVALFDVVNGVLAILALAHLNN